MKYSGATRVTFNVKLNDKMKNIERNPFTSNHEIQFSDNSDWLLAFVITNTRAFTRSSTTGTK